ncbi:phage regulatory protein/antirepressor Ant [Paracoccus sp. PS-1]|uniref:phage regulatory protein/antirepressor Ant n=1 Tax=Paracoccus sp. PS1 TaxID=2963938 RepID=UPI0027E419A6|nr:phage regulatory protein/antirepressor Ant [Paracoccus sp. PS1]MDQ7262277.1 phage regulatory protein/antirepressor Ant [Paracoccus sp. PS1]
MNMIANHDDFNGIVIEQRNGVLMASSREVARNFGKQHKDVLRAIRNLECSPEFNERNFAPVEYLDAKGEARTEYGMTRDGFTFLVMGFTGKEAAAWKEKYIAAFNAMEARLRQSSQIDLSDPAQLVPLLTSYAQRTQVAEAKVAELSPKAEAFDVLDASEGCVTVREAAKLLGVPERKFVRWLQQRGWAFRQNGIGSLQAYADKRMMGYLEHKPHTYYDQRQDLEVTKSQMVVTPKGLARLAAIFAKEGVPA